MAQDPRLTEFLRWSVAHSDATVNNESPESQSQVTPEMMAALMGGPSDADLMKASMELITAPDAEVSMDNKLIAWENLEQLIESLDNANNMASLGLWGPLLAQLKHDEGEVKKMAAWCVGTAVQNNEKTQERLVAMGDAGLPTLVALALGGAGEAEDVRRKAVYALSSACRNYQPAMDVFVEELGRRGVGDGVKIDAFDMDAVDAVIGALREKIKGA
ncbi:Hsp70 nucleotide exchange factor (Fes1) [Metarhizium album ARSEF 1941]|uniref:Hsp70 nucleotide exchange factor (Fes1) n=1 Tax=Metarhizium album (strain ARSEF 1941) TaxID=1081103 RepID=A0A0B2WP76_METAS|nr:Hsp70 nucleotide exchange factor (Fes1) [Metarhizium album ARSEF 1941]KHN95813.1 Hsp70 nucleotide exchange factor (Fes1) [Metarhizium album ARSEF 1941]